MEADIGVISSTSQGRPRIAGHTTRSWRGKEAPHPLQISEECGSAYTLLSYFWPPELQDNKLLLLKPPCSWYFVIAALEINTELLGRFATSWDNSMVLFLLQSILPHQAEVKLLSNLQLCLTSSPVLSWVP